MDWHSRYVLAWELSTTPERSFCLETLRRALQISKPGIFNTDQGTQFTSPEFTGLVESEGIKVSMDGRGRVYDNIFIERLWPSVKYEEVCLHDDATIAEARAHLAATFHYRDRRSTVKWLLGIERAKMVTTGGPSMHLQKASKLSRQCGLLHPILFEIAIKCQMR